MPPVFSTKLTIKIPTVLALLRFALPAPIPIDREGLGVLGLALGAAAATIVVSTLAHKPPVTASIGKGGLGTLSMKPAMGAAIKSTTTHSTMITSDIGSIALHGANYLLGNSVASGGVKVGGSSVKIGTTSLE
jgi:hypothetical protein